MDVSPLFKASVKIVNLRNKELGMTVSPKNPQQKTRSPFHTKILHVVKQISMLQELLLENRKAYLNFHNHLSTAPQMTDAERDKIDTGAQNIMSTCSQLVKDLKREVAISETSQQNIEHREIMLLMIEDYLKNVCKLYSEQKAMRVKKNIEMRKIVKLQSDPKPTDSPSATNSKKILNTVQKLTDDHENKNDSGDSSPMKIQEINGDVNTLTYEEELSPEDIQMFHSENEQLYSELNTLTEEVKQIESKVVHIAELQEIFTEKILDQDKDLDRLMTTVVGSTENVKEANEQIRQAIQRNAGLRVWILFFLLVMSFSLLFLDWYNP